MNPAEDRAGEGSQVKESRIAGELDEIKELAGRLDRLIVSLKGEPGKIGGIVRDASDKSRPDLLNKARSLCEALEALKQAPGELVNNPAPDGSKDVAPENLPVEGKTSSQKEKPVDTLETQEGAEVSVENSSGAMGTTPQVADSPAEPLFSGEAKLVISPPVRMDTLLKLYNYLQTLPDIKLVYTSGAKDTEVAITISVDKPTSISKLLSGMGVTLATGGAVGQVPGEEVRPLFERKKNPVKELRLVVKE